MARRRRFGSSGDRVRGVSGTARGSFDDGHREGFTRQVRAAIRADVRALRFGCTLGSEDRAKGALTGLVSVARG